MNHTRLLNALGKAGTIRTGHNAGNDHRGQWQHWSARKGDAVIEWSCVKRVGEKSFVVSGSPRARRIDDVDIPGDYLAGMFMRTIKSCVRWIETVGAGPAEK